MPHKKRLFTKGNSVKFLLLHGNTQAVNAEGKNLENVLVPVSKNYKPGTSLIMSNVAALCNSEEIEDTPEEADLKKIMDVFDDSDTEVDIESLSTDMKKLNYSERSKSKSCSGDDNEDEDEDVKEKEIFVNYNFEVDGQFSDISDSFETISDDEDDDLMTDPNCPESLKIFNKKFEKVLKEYHDDQIGPLDEEDICGYLSTSSKRVTDLLDDENLDEEGQFDLGKCSVDIKQKILNYAEDSGEENIVEIVTEKPIEFDCESILSTYSNKYNHPAVITEERIKKIQIPHNPLKKRLTKSQLKTLSDEKESDSESDDDLSVSTAINVRVKSETPEQKRERKHLFKEAKRESRILKKENKLAFKREKKLQQSQSLNVQRNAGIRLL